MRPFDWTVWLTNLNYLSLLLLFILAIVILIVMTQVCVFTLTNNECPLRDHYDQERLREYDARRVATLSVISDSPYSPWFDVLDYSSNTNKDADSDSLLTMTTASDVYMDRRLSVDLNEKIYLKVSQT